MTINKKTFKIIISILIMTVDGYAFQDSFRM